LVADDQRLVNPLVKGMRETIKVTPTVRGDDLALAFDISSGGKPNELATRRCDAPIDPVDACKYFQPSLVISKAVKGVSSGHQRPLGKSDSPYRGLSKDRAGCIVDSALASNPQTFL
jgi:hypothetical protein